MLEKLPQSFNYIQIRAVGWLVYYWLFPEHFVQQAYSRLGIYHFSFLNYNRMIFEIISPVQIKPLSASVGFNNHVFPFLNQAVGG